VLCKAVITRAKYTFYSAGSGNDAAHGGRSDEERWCIKVGVS
jgi:hypothetical protein